MVLLGALMLGAGATAQQGEQPADGAAAFKALVQEYGKAEQECIAQYRKAADKAKEDHAATPAFPFQQLTNEWVPKFLAGAERFKGTDGAIPFLTWAYGNDPQGSAAALETLLRDHLKSPKFGNVVMLIGHRSKAIGRERTESILQQVVEQNPDADVKAKALLACANMLLEPVQEGASIDSGARAKALSDLRMGLDCVKDGKVKRQLAGVINEQEHLQVGMTAPDIEGKDLDGVDFKLSDYRGKVVLLDFWGYW
jgi:hypothetical protein